MTEKKRFLPPRPKTLPEAFTRLFRHARPDRWTLRAVVGTIAAALLMAFCATGLSKVEIQTSISSFLPASDASLTELNKEEAAFGGDPIVVLLESHQPRRLLDTAHLTPQLQLEGRLAHLPDVAAVYGPGTALNQIAGQAQNLLAELSGKRDAAQALAVAKAKEAGQSAAQATAAGKKALNTFDRRYGALVTQGMPTGLPTLSNQSFVQSVIYSGQGVRPQWRFLTPTANSAAILVRPRQDMDAASTRALVEAVQNTVDEENLKADKTTVSGVPVVVSAVNDQVGDEIPLIGGLALLTVGGIFWLMPWTRRSRRLLPLGTTLAAIAVTLALFGWLGRPLSIGVIAFVSVLLGIGSYYPTYLTQRARTRVVLVVACASAASFATLVLSPLPFVRDIGWTLSVGVLLSASLGLLLSRIQRSPRPQLPQPGSSAPPRPGAARRAAAAACAALVLACFGWSQLPGLALDASVESFADGVSAMQDATHVESVLGSSGEVDIVLTGKDVTSEAAVAWMQRAQSTVISGYGDQMRPATSLPTLLTFLGDSPPKAQIDSGLRLLPPYLKAAVVTPDKTRSTLLFGVKMNDLTALKSLRNSVTASLPPPPPGYHVELTGLPTVAVRAEELVSANRVFNNLLGIITAGAVLLVGLQRRGDALRAVATAATATGVGLAVFSLTGTPLSPVTAALGPLTAAVGCEFTVLLAEARRSGSLQLRRSVLLATLTSTAGYAVLVASGLATVRQFGVLLAGSVLLALLSAACVVGATIRSDPALPARQPVRPSEESATPLVGAR
ncbi:hypothetical protein ACWFR5_14505 [Streptomyces sp. NPDC055092]